MSLYCDMCVNVCRPIKASLEQTVGMIADWQTETVPAASAGNTFSFSDEVVATLDHLADFDHHRLPSSNRL